jgi:hypothetical protein
LYDSHISKIFLLLYADDTVLMSENINGMQTMLNIFSEYCNTWKLQVNIAKTKWLHFQKVMLISFIKSDKRKGEIFSFV